MDKTIVLITGANSGIGFELAAQLLADPSKHVLLGSRSREKGEAAVRDLESRSLAGVVELVQVDVSDEDSIAAAARHVETTHQRLDALVNNAAIAVLPPSTLFARLTQALATNATGPAAMVAAFAPLLAISKTPRIINVSSAAGSITKYQDPRGPGYRPLPADLALPYHASKAALNMVTAVQAAEYGARGWRVFAYCPGFTVSGISPLNTAAAGAKPTCEGAAPMVDILAGRRDAEHGCFLSAGGGQYPW